GTGESTAGGLLVTVDGADVQSKMLTRVASRLFSSRWYAEQALGIQATNARLVEILGNHSRARDARPARRDQRRVRGMHQCGMPRCRAGPGRA
ncbi:MAG TPA: hypothetical protein VGR62_05250, partial [Candidatus Binatia bacterium]|nr:hypothetical protein [Candidatus Binatia bacterium]